jgi:hypothetical protein
MASELKQTLGVAYNRNWYENERQAMLAAMSDADEGDPAPLVFHKAVRYDDGSVIVMDDYNVVIDRFRDDF